MCNNGYSINGHLEDRYAGNPYFSSGITRYNGTNYVRATVVETGESITLPFGGTNSLDAWIDARLLCY